MLTALKTPALILIVTLVIYVCAIGNHSATADKFKFDQRWPTNEAYSLSDPKGIAMDLNGNFYVADYGSKRIVALYPNGDFFTQFPSPDVQQSPLNGPVDVAVDSLGDVYVANLDFDVVIFRNDGNVDIWNDFNGTSIQSYSVAVDPTGNIFVADNRLDRILRYTNDGRPLGECGSEGAGKDQFDIPNDLVVSSNFTIYISDSDNKKIKIANYDPINNKCDFQNPWDPGPNSEFGSNNGPGMVALDDQGYVYASDPDNDRVFKFNHNGTVIGIIDQSVPNDKTFDFPRGVLVKDDKLYVTVSKENAIEVLELTSTLPTARFEITDTEPHKVDKNITFDASASFDVDGPLISWVWTFGDGQGDSGNRTTAHTYSDPDKYIVTLTVFDSQGESNSYNQTITVVQNKKPLASLEFSALASLDTPVKFSAEGSSDSDGEIRLYEWTFGDGTSNRTQINEIYHAYKSKGSFPVSLVVIDDNNARSDPFPGTITIQGNEPPIADFTVEKKSKVNQPSVLSARDSRDVDGTIAGYFWEFEGNITSTNMTVAHVFETQGLNSGKLTVTDNLGASSTVGWSIDILDNAPPVADFSIQGSRIAWFEIFFDGKSSYDPDGNITNFKWDFGDGTIIEGNDKAVVSHHFLSNSENTVTLWVTDSDGVTRKDDNSITTEYFFLVFPLSLIWIVLGIVGSIISVVELRDKDSKIRKGMRNAFK